MTCGAQFEIVFLKYNFFLGETQLFIKLCYAQNDLRVENELGVNVHVVERVKVIRVARQSVVIPISMEAEVRGDHEN